MPATFGSADLSTFFGLASPATLASLVADFEEKGARVAHGVRNQQLVRFALDKLNAMVGEDAALLLLEKHGATWCADSPNFRKALAGGRV